MLILLTDPHGRTVACDATRIVQIRDDRDVPGCSRLTFERCSAMVVRGLPEQLQARIYEALSEHQQRKVSCYAQSLGDLWNALQSQSAHPYGVPLGESPAQQNTSHAGA